MCRTIESGVVSAARMTSSLVPRDRDLVVSLHTQVSKSFKGKESVKRYVKNLLSALLELAIMTALLDQVKKLLENTSVKSSHYAGLKGFLTWVKAASAFGQAADSFCSDIATLGMVKSVGVFSILK